MTSGFTWQPIATNGKTGPIPTAYCGHSIEEMRQSCDGCPLLDNGCYAHGGTPKLGFGAMAKAASGGQSNRSLKGRQAVRPGGRYSLEYALENHRPDVRAVRIGSLGEPARVPRREYHRAQRAWRSRGFAVLSYTHFWQDRENAKLRETALASCDDDSAERAGLSSAVELADVAIDAGWIPTAIVDDEPAPTVETPAGNTLLVCPAQRSPGKVTCDDCRLCDAKAPFWRQQIRVQGIAFWRHGQ